MSRRRRAPAKLRPKAPPITFRIDAATHRALRARAKLDRCRQSDVLRYALREYLGIA